MVTITAVGIAIAIPIAFIFGFLLCFIITGKALATLENQVQELYIRNKELERLLKGHSSLTKWNR